MRLLIPIAPIFYIINNPINGLTLILSMVVILAGGRILLDFINDIRFGRLAKKHIPEKDLAFYINKK